MLECKCIHKFLALKGFKDLNKQCNSHAKFLKKAKAMLLRMEVTEDTNILYENSGGPKRWDLSTDISKTSNPSLPSPNKVQF